jgi:hypothetical protein
VDCLVDGMSGKLGESDWRSGPDYGEVHYTRSNRWHTTQGTLLTGAYPHLSLRKGPLPDLPDVAPELDR